MSVDLRNDGEEGYAKAISRCIHKRSFRVDAALYPGAVLAGSRRKGPGGQGRRRTENSREDTPTLSVSDATRPHA